MQRHPNSIKRRRQQPHQHPHQHPHQQPHQQPQQQKQPKLTKRQFTPYNLQHSQPPQTTTPTTTNTRQLGPSTICVRRDRPRPFSSQSTDAQQYISSTPLLTSVPIPSPTTTVGIEQHWGYSDLSKIDVAVDHYRLLQEQQHENGVPASCLPYDHPLKDTLEGLQPLVASHRQIHSTSLRFTTPLRTDLTQGVKKPQEYVIYSFQCFKKKQIVCQLAFFVFFLSQTCCCLFLMSFACICHYPPPSSINQSATLFYFLIIYSNSKYEST